MGKSVPPREPSDQIKATHVEQVVYEHLERACAELLKTGFIAKRPMMFVKTDFHKGGLRLILGLVTEPRVRDMKLVERAGAYLTKLFYADDEPK
jgi:hypothetical protein